MLFFVLAISTFVYTFAKQCIYKFLRMYIQMFEIVYTFCKSKVSVPKILYIHLIGFVYTNPQQVLEMYGSLPMYIFKKSYILCI